MKKLLLMLLFPVLVFSQTNEEKKRIISQSNIKTLKAIAQKSSFQFNENKRKAQELAKIKLWPHC